MASSSVDTPSTSAPAGRPSSGGPAPRTVLIVGAALLVSILMIAVVAGVLVRAKDGPQRESARGIARSADRIATGPVEGVRRATFDLVSGVTSVAVRGAELGDTLYRVETPQGSSLVPVVVRAGERVETQLRDVGGGGASAVVVQLNRSVRWTVRLTAGSTTSTVDLRDTAVEGVEFIGGTSVIDLTLPKPTGTVVARMSGGASRFAVHLPEGAPVRVRAGGGAGNLRLDDQERSGVAGGTVLVSPGWESAADRYDVDATAGVSSMTVDHTA